MLLKYKEAFHHTLAMLTIGFNEFCSGMGVGWVSPTLNALQRSDSSKTMSMEEFSWIASIDQFGRILGCILAAIILDKIGRKSMLICSAMIFFLVWIILIFSKSFIVICTARVIFGIAVGIESGTNSVYIGENLSPKMRGFFGTMSLAMYDVGMFCETVLATCFPYRTTAILNFFIQVAFFPASYWLRESVPFLLMKGKQDQAMENIMWLKGVTDADDVKTDFEKIKLNVQAEKAKKASFAKLLTSRANYKSTSIIVIIYLLGGMTGYATILSYASLMFPSSEIMSPNAFTILFTAVQLIITLMASFLVDNFNRRSLIITSFTMAGAIHCFTAFLYYMQYNLFEAAYGPWFIFLSITLYSVVYQFVYPALFLIRSELFPLSIRAIGTCVTRIGISFINFVMIKIFMYIYSNFGIHYNFVIFAFSSWILVLYVYFILPETRNRSLIEIQEALEKQK